MASLSEPGPLSSRFITVKVIGIAVALCARPPPDGPPIMIANMISGIATATLILLRIFAWFTGLFLQPDLFLYWAYRYTGL